MAPAVSTLASPTPNAASVDQPLAATIPPELLMQIFDEVQDQTNFTEAQRERINQSKVCRSWHCARVKRNEFFAHRDRATALMTTLEADPARAAQVQKISLAWVSDTIAPLLRLCTSAVEVELSTFGRFSPATMAAIPASVRKLKLKISECGTSDWIPDLSSLSNQVQLELVLAWYNNRPSEAQRVVAAISPVLGQIAELALIDRWDADRPHERGYLEPVISKLTALNDFEVNLWQVRPDRLASSIGQLDSLTTLRIVHSRGDEDLWDFTADVVADVIAAAKPALEFIGIGEKLIYSASSADWCRCQMHHLVVIAAKRGIHLEFLDDEDESEGSERSDDGSEDDEDEWETTSDESDDHDE